MGNSNLISKFRTRIEQKAIDRRENPLDFPQLRNVVRVIISRYRTFNLI